METLVIFPSPVQMACSVTSLWLIPRPDSVNQICWLDYNRVPSTNRTLTTTLRSCLWWIPPQICSCTSDLTWMGLRGWTPLNTIIWIEREWGGIDPSEWAHLLMSDKHNGWTVSELLIYQADAGWSNLIQCKATSRQLWMGRAKKWQVILTEWHIEKQQIMKKNQTNTRCATT